MPDEKQDALALPKQPETKLAVRTSAYMPQNVTEAMALAKLIAQSDLAPKDYKSKPANVMIAMQMGAEVGLSPMASIQNIAVINGRPSLWGDAALAVVQAHPAYESHKEWIDGSGEAKTAHCTVKRKGQDAYTATFSVAQARTAKLLSKDGTWQTYPDRMLQMRARGFALRDKFADALRGLILAEEAMDIPPDAPKRERAALDADALSALSPSEEPNRGHGNEGMQQQTPPEQTEPKPANVMVRGPVVVNKVEAQLKKPTRAMIEKAKKEKAPEPQGQEYFILTCTGEDGIQNPVASWHKSLHQHVVRMQGKLCEVTLAKHRRKDDGTFTFSLEHIHSIGDEVFENDVPVAQAESGEYQAPTGSEMFPEQQ